LPQTRKRDREKVGAESDSFGSSVQQYSSRKAFPRDLLQGAEPFEIATVNSGARFDLDSDETAG